MKMDKYYVNDNTQSTGEHEVHKNAQVTLRAETNSNCHNL